MSELAFYVVALERKSGGLRESRKAEVVEARSIEDAARAALEGERWEVEDGVYVARVAKLDELEQIRVRRSTETEITVLEASAV